MKRSRVLHGHERVALQNEAGHAHQHREHVVIEGLGWIAEEPPPDVGAGAKAKCTRRIEFGRQDRLHQTAALEAFWSTSDLVSVQFAGFIGADDNQAFQVDNIALDVTRGSELPEPGSLALGALALAAAWHTRRATSRAAQQAA